MAWYLHSCPSPSASDWQLLTPPSPIILILVTPPILPTWLLANQYFIKPVWVSNLCTVQKDDSTAVGSYMAAEAGDRFPTSQQTRGGDRETLELGRPSCFVFLFSLFTFWVGPPSLVGPLWESPQRCTHKCILILWVFLNPLLKLPVTQTQDVFLMRTFNIYIYILAVFNSTIL